MVPAFAEPETVVIAACNREHRTRALLTIACTSSMHWANRSHTRFPICLRLPVRPMRQSCRDQTVISTISRSAPAASMRPICTALCGSCSTSGRAISKGRSSGISLNTSTRLELIPHLDWDNAQSGYGFIETGYGFDEDYGQHPFCLNFDILSHELGHSFVYALVGIPAIEHVTAEYVGFQEAASDIVALLSTLHFKSVVDHILAETRGNIYAPNELNRFAELSPTHQIRSASNSIRMGDVPDVRIPFERLSEPDRHLLSQPLTGAVFDILVELFQTDPGSARSDPRRVECKVPPRRPGYRRRGGNACPGVIQ